MPLPDIPPEIWATILPYLRKPIPAPLSSPSRSAIRQNDLASASRVCKLWHNIVERPLYSHIVTDRFAELILSTPSLANCPRFAHTQSMYLEYSSKTNVVKATYGMLMARGRELWEFPRVPDLKAQVLVKCSEEVEELMFALKTINTVGVAEYDEHRWGAVGMAHVFPSLRTMAVASIWGQRSNLWSSYLEDDVTFHQHNAMLNKCNELFDHFTGSGDLRHLCVRDLRGPLAPHYFCHKFAHTGPSIVPHITTVHFGADVARLPVMLAANIRWVSDIPMQEEWVALLHQMGRTIRIINNARHGSDNPCFWEHHLDIDIYFSTDRLCLAPGYGTSLKLLGLGDGPIMQRDVLSPPRDITPKMQKKICAKLGPLLSEWYSDDSNAPPSHPPQTGTSRRDEVRWHPAYQTPVCEACGSAGPPC